MNINEKLLFCMHFIIPVHETQNSYHLVLFTKTGYAHKVKVTIFNTFKNYRKLSLILLMNVLFADCHLITA